MTLFIANDYDPNQPRDQRGRWTEASGFAARLKGKVLADSLGILRPQVTLIPEIERVQNPPEKRHFSGNYREETTGRWKIRSTSELLDDVVFTSKEEAKLAMHKAGFRLDKEELPENPWHPSLEWKMQYTHLPTERAYAQGVSRHHAKWDNAQEIFLRYGDLPKGGRSRNYADGFLERGTSVFRGKKLPTGEVVILPTNPAQIAGAHTLSDRPLYEVSGEEVGLGSDGEPVLKGARIVRKIR